jgi:hypothetical protein
LRFGANVHVARLKGRSVNRAGDAPKHDAMDIVLVEHLQNPPWVKRLCLIHPSRSGFRETNKILQSPTILNHLVESPLRRERQILLY